MFTNFALIHVQVLLAGLVWTVVLSIISFVFGGLIGFVLALAGVAKNRFVAGAVNAYAALIQGSPVLIIMFVIYFGLPILGVEVGSLMAASVAMVLFSSASDPELAAPRGHVTVLRSGSLSDLSVAEVLQAANALLPQA